MFGKTQKKIKEIESRLNTIEDRQNALQSELDKITGSSWMRSCPPSLDELLCRLNNLAEHLGYVWTQETKTGFQKKIKTRRK